MKLWMYHEWNRMESIALQCWSFLIRVKFNLGREWSERLLFIPNSALRVRFFLRFPSNLMRKQSATTWIKAHEEIWLPWFSGMWGLLLSLVVFFFGRRLCKFVKRWKKTWKNIIPAGERQNRRSHRMGRTLFVTHDFIWPSSRRCFLIFSSFFIALYFELIHVQCPTWFVLTNVKRKISRGWVMCNN